MLLSSRVMLVAVLLGSGGALAGAPSEEALSQAREGAFLVAEELGRCGGQFLALSELYMRRKENENLSVSLQEVANAWVSSGAWALWNLDAVPEMRRAIGFTEQIAQVEKRRILAMLALDGQASVDAIGKKIDACSEDLGPFVTDSVREFRRFIYAQPQPEIR